MHTNAGKTVADISKEKQVLLIFLRHLSCLFCQEALKDIKNIEDDLKAKNTDVVFVHMADTEIANDVFQNYKLPAVQHISDKNKELYEQFALSKGDFRQLFGFKSFFGMGRAALKGNFGGVNPIGDPQQLPGVFVVNDSKVSNYFIYNSVGDYPNYLELIENSK